MGINDKAWSGGFKRCIGDMSLGATLAIATDTDTKQVHICDITDVGTDWGLSADSYPSLYIHDIAAPITDYVKIYHDGTTGIYNTDGTTVFTTTASALAVALATTFSAAVTSTSTTVLGVTSTLVPDQTYTNYVLAMGWKGAANELDVTFANSTNQNLNLLQTNLNCLAVSTGPTASSQMNVMHSLITHDTTDMTNLRLKCADFNVVVGKDVKDAYAYQGEIDITDSAVGGEASVMGLVMNCPSGTVTGTMRGLIVAMTGASMPSTTSIGILVSTNTSATITEGLRLESQNGTTITSGVTFAASSTGNITAAITCLGDGMANITNFINAPSLNGCFNTTSSFGSQIGRILVNWGGTQRAIPVYALS